jgi:broad specificity phosphatase PhoE
MSGKDLPDMTILEWPSALWLVRHGESLGNVANAEARRSQALRLEVDASDSEIGLTDLGADQARAVGRWMAELSAADRPTQVVVSPYIRTRETARLLIETAHLDDIPTTVDERLRDREQGVLDRLTGAGFRDKYPEEAARREYVGKFWFRPSGGESWADVALRVRAVLLELRLTMPDERILVVTHDVVILIVRYILERLAPTEATQWSGQLRNCSLTTYRRAADNDGMHLERFNDVTALERHSAPVTAND